MAENAGHEGKSQRPWCLNIREAQRTFSSPSFREHACSLPGTVPALALNVLCGKNPVVPGKNLKVRKRPKEEFNSSVANQDED